ncbi:MAG: hypothetical protein HW375_315 [Anaerolineales bacterium]|nr:hypothetical protein [Anaerolineales bacterium]
MAGLTTFDESVIHDVLLTPLSSAPAGRQAILAFEDHLLRRFGSAEVVRLGPGETFRVLRGKADEVWALLEGAAEFQLEDQRSTSPTLAVSQAVRKETPTRLLLPFGVRLLVRPDPRALLLRIMTHSEADDPPLPENA